VREQQPAWCDNATHLAAGLNEWTCVNMSMLTCTAKAPLNDAQYAGIAIGGAALLLILIMATSLSLNMCIARTGKIRRQLHWCVWQQQSRQCRHCFSPILKLLYATRRFPACRNQQPATGTCP
jgi:formamidopyrimidine-DNA glycosylase